MIEQTNIPTAQTGNATFKVIDAPGTVFVITQFGQSIILDREQAQSMLEFFNPHFDKLEGAGL